MDECMEGGTERGGGLERTPRSATSTTPGACDRPRRCARDVARVWVDVVVVLFGARFCKR